MNHEAPIQFDTGRTANSSDQNTSGVEGTDATVQSGTQRRSFLRGAMLAVAAPAAIWASAPESAEAQTRRNFFSRDRFESIRTHENDHVAALLDFLGQNARPKPIFQNLEQRNFLSFARVSQALENTGVGAYLGAAPQIASPTILAAAGSIALIEGRHAGYLNVLLGDPITNSAIPMGANNPSFEMPLSPEDVARLAGPFIADLRGVPLTYSTSSTSAANDIAILNFALALEYLEAEYYNINVPKFFS